MNGRLAAAPVSFGVWEQRAEGGDRIPAADLLEAVAAAGFDGVELGPPGYLGVAEAAASGLALAGGFAPLHLTDEDAFEHDLAVWVDPLLAVLAGSGAAGPVVLSDAETPVRAAGAGRPDEQRRTALDGDGLARALDRIERAAGHCRARGVEAVFHHHTGTFFESPEEILTVADGTDVPLCLDTGHAAVGGGDPVELARVLGPRIGHLHLKDVDATVLRRVRDGEAALGEVWGSGLYCPLGEGIVDVAGVLGLPELRGFRGWIVLEQDRLAVMPDELPRVRAAEAANLHFVRGR